MPILSSVSVTVGRFLQIVSFIVGFGGLIYIDWRIAGCVLLTHWANNARIYLEGKG